MNSETSSPRYFIISCAPFSKPTHSLRNRGRAHVLILMPDVSARQRNESVTEASAKLRGYFHFHVTHLAWIRAPRLLSRDTGTERCPQPRRDPTHVTGPVPANNRVRRGSISPFSLKVCRRFTIIASHFCQPPPPGNEGMRGRRGGPGRRRKVPTSCGVRWPCCQRQLQDTEHEPYLGAVFDLEAVLLGCFIIAAVTVKTCRRGASFARG